MNDPRSDLDQQLKSLLKSLPEQETSRDFDLRLAQALTDQTKAHATTRARSWKDLLQPARGGSGTTISGITAPSRGWMIGGGVLLGILIWGAAPLIDTLFFAPELAEVDLLSVMLFGAL